MEKTELKRSFVTTALRLLSDPSYGPINMDYAVRQVFESTTWEGIPASNLKEMSILILTSAILRKDLFALDPAEIPVAEFSSEVLEQYLERSRLRILPGPE